MFNKLYPQGWKNIAQIHGPHGFKAVNNKQAPGNADNHLRDVAARLLLTEALTKIGDVKFVTEITILLTIVFYPSKMILRHKYLTISHVGKMILKG